MKTAVTRLWAVLMERLHYSPEAIFRFLNMPEASRGGILGGIYNEKHLVLPWISASHMLPLQAQSSQYFWKISRQHKQWLAPCYLARICLGASRRVWLKIRQDFS